MRSKKDQAVENPTVLQYCTKDSENVPVTSGSIKN